MTRQEFINKIAPLIVKYASQYNILCPSAVIAQAVLESDGGNSELALNAHNYFGLKYRANRCPSACGIYYKDGSEQNKDGSYTTSTMQWMKFSSMENGVRGYFDFINISNYANLKGVKDPKKYLENIKADGYATSLNYVDNVYRVIQTYDLTKFDKKEETNMSYTNSSLVNYTLLSPNCSKPRNNKITKIVIHHMAGNLTVEACGKVFQPTSRQASSNYGVGTDGRVGMYVEECNRAWTSGNATIDNQAITIEVANDVIGGNWHVSDKALQKTIELCADICKRNDIKKLNFTGDKNGNLVAHRYYQATACPGEYLYSKFSYIADEVNKLLGVATSTAKTYTVVSGDTLSKIGSKTGVNWKTIAELNGIKFPYIIKKGQVLKLSEGTVETKPSTSTTTSTPSTTTTVVPLKVTATKKGVQEFLNTYYGTEIKKVVGALLVVDGLIGAKSKLALGVAIQVELNKLGAGLVVDGKIGANSANAWNKYVGTLKRGSKGIFVTLWQCLIVANGVALNGGIDGDFGTGSANASNALFAKAGLSRDSSVSGSDINALL